MSICPCAINLLYICRNWRARPYPLLHRFDHEYLELLQCHRSDEPGWQAHQEVWRSQSLQIRIRLLSRMLPNIPFFNLLCAPEWGCWVWIWCIYDYSAIFCIFLDYVLWFVFITHILCIDPHWFPLSSLDSSCYRWNGSKEIDWIHQWHCTVGWLCHAHVCSKFCHFFVLVLYRKTGLWWSFGLRGRLYYCYLRHRFQQAIARQ